MTASLFYSWQSDLPSSVTRHLVREALEIAVVAVNDTVKIEDAMRVTSDTEGAPGHPPIFETILGKIDTCSVFVTDLSIVTEISGNGPEKKGLFNPNVAIEYGYALKALGQKRIIPVMNTAFGGLQKLPFDMAHRRGPIRFNLPENAKDEVIEREKNKLIEELVVALKVMHEHRLLDEIQENIAEPAFIPVAPYEGSDANNRSILLGRLNLDRLSEEGETYVWLRKGPTMFLRLIPTITSEQYEPLDLKDLIFKAELKDLMGYKTKGPFCVTRNGDGAAAFTIEDKQEAGDSSGDGCFARGFTQVFTNGEIWGEDTWLLDPDRSSRHTEEELANIGSFTIEEGLIVALSQYLKFARDQLALSAPIRWVAGINNIRDHRLAIDGGYSGLPYNDTIVRTGLIEDFTTPIHQALEPFFEAVWGEFGVRRPPSMSDPWEEASGFDLR